MNLVDKDRTTKVYIPVHPCIFWDRGSHYSTTHGRDTCMHQSYPVTLDPELVLAAQKAVLDLQTLRDPRTLIKRFDGLLQTRFRVLLSERYVA